MILLQVLATGLSGLYSDLPRKIIIPSEDWCQITDEDVHNIPEMAMFLNSLEFCNAVAQVNFTFIQPGYIYLSIDLDKTSFSVY
jgi:hypothetical protein